MKQKLRFFTVLSITYFVFYIFMFVSWTSANTSVTLNWTPNKDTISGYRIYQSKRSGQYTFGKGNEVADVNVSSATLEVPDGTYFWVVTAYTDNAESSYDKEVTKVIKNSELSEIEISVELVKPNPKEEITKEEAESIGWWLFILRLFGLGAS